MIAHLRGRVAHRDSERVVIDVGGIGWLVHVADAGVVPAVGQEAKLHTSLQVREDSMDLYGFTTRAGLRMFELLLTASGVGPRIGLAALRTHRPELLRDALSTGDIAMLTAVPGIGRKGAQRMVLELRDKVGSLAGDLPAGETGTTAGWTAEPTPLSEAREALAQLGYREAEITAALAGAPVGADTSSLVHHALRGVGAQR